MQYFVDEIARQAAANPVAPALISPYGSISYEELLDTIIKVSNLFDDRRLPRGARAYLNIKDAELRFAVCIAALSYGLVPAIATPETLKREYDYDFTISAAAPLREDIPADIVIDGAVLTGKLADGRRREFPERGDDDLALLSETTGTTGHAKLLASTKKALIAGYRTAARIHFEPRSRNMFGMGSISRYGFLHTLMTLGVGGATVSAPVDPIAALRLIELYQVADLRTTPMGAQRMVEAMERYHLRAPSLKVLGVGGSLLSLDLLKRIEANFTAAVMLGYGTSESARLASGTVSVATYQRGYVGEVAKGVTFVTVGTRDNPGPIVIANNLDNQTKYIVGGKFVVDDSPTVTLPDLGFVEDNKVFLIGRADEVFNYSGNKLAFDALQQEIERTAQVRDIGIASGRSIGLDEDLVVGIAADKPINLDALADQVLKALGWAKARERFRFFQLPAIPRNAMAKVDRQALLKQYAEAHPVTHH